MPDQTAQPDLASLAKNWEDLHAHPPSVLYHSTTAAGLLGILNSQRVWATNARFLNDPSEIRYALGIVSEIVGQEEKAYGEARDARCDPRARPRAHRSYPPG